MKYLSFLHVSHYISVAMILRFLEYEDIKVFSSFLSENLSFYSNFSSVLAKNDDIARKTVVIPLLID